MVQRICGTCDWSLKTREYRQWNLEENRSLLLLLGNAGMGKTMLCNFVIEDLERPTSPNARHSTVVRFFCDYHPERNTATAVLAGLLLQLLEKHERSFKHVRSVYLQHKETLFDHVGNLWAIISKLLKSISGEVYLIIDGMDRCDEVSRKILYELLISSLRIKDDSLTFRVLLTSRSESDFKGCPIPTGEEVSRVICNCQVLKVEQRNVSQDLRKSVFNFIQKRVESLPVSCDMQQTIHHEISKKAGDTYLWASFVLQDLDQAHTYEEVDMKLQNLPQTLHEVYDRMLGDIELSKEQEASFVLRVAALARRPLTPKELGLLYVLRPEKWDTRGLQSLKQVKSYGNLHTTCKSLVQLDSSGAMSFVHQSVKEYLLDDQLLTNYSSNSFLPRSNFSGSKNARVYTFIASAVETVLGTVGLIRGISRYHIVPDETHLLLFKICWTCFCAEEFQQGKKIIVRTKENELKPNSDLTEVLRSRSEPSYIVKEWQEHALAAGQALRASRAWLSHNLIKLPNLRDTLLHRVVMAGDVKTARLLLDNGADIKTRWGDHGSIIHGPSCAGNEEMVKLLLDHGADIDAKGPLFDSALEGASFNGHEMVVRLLIDRGAVVNAKDKNSCSALQAAAVNGCTSVVRTLLDSGANVNSSGGRHPRPLQGAAARGYLEMVDLLLARGAEVNAQGQGETYALQAASCKGHLDVVKLLVKHGADINATGGVHGSALQAAIDSCNSAVEDWLTECGAESHPKENHDNPLYSAALRGNVEEVQALLPQYDVNSQGGKHGSPLQAAAYKGHENTVQLLIKSAADVNARGGKHGSALQAAAYSGHTNIVQLLLDKGAIANAQMGITGNALHAAAVKGHVETLRVLLDHGVSANICGESYGTALHAAIGATSRDNNRAARLLLDHGALANAQGSFCGTPLQLAAYRGDIATAKLLLHNGANVNMNGGQYGFALQAAATVGKTDMVKLLLDHGANVNAKGGEYGFALQAAAFAGQKEIAKLLLDSGALINAQGGKYDFALQAAAFEGQKDIVELLLEHGADVNAKGGEFDSALQAAAYSGHKWVVEYLLDHDADIEAKGGRYGFALQAAAYKGRKEIVKLLLNRGANVNAEGGEYGFALQAAAYKGKGDIIELLLEQDALINSEGGLYGTALKAARYDKHENVIQLLQQRGARLDRKGSRGMPTGKVAIEDDDSLVSPFRVGLVLSITIMVGVTVRMARTYGTHY